MFFCCCFTIFNRVFDCHYQLGVLLYLRILNTGDLLLVALIHWRCNIDLRLGTPNGMHRQPISASEAPTPVNYRGGASEQGCPQVVKSQDRDETETVRRLTVSSTFCILRFLRPRRSIFPNSQDRDETETFNLQDRDETETFQKTS